MASPKRASMREGPLAALFRKTEDADGPGDGSQAPGASGAPRTASDAGASLPPVHPRESGLPHPALTASAQAPPREEVRVASPQERLRHAFSSELAGNVMDRPASGGSLVGDYAREYDAPVRPPATVGRPVIRVVGVGG